MVRTLDEYLYKTITATLLLLCFPGVASATIIVNSWSSNNIVLINATQDLSSSNVTIGFLWDTFNDSILNSGYIVIGTATESGGVLNLTGSGVHVRRSLLYNDNFNASVKMMTVVNGTATYHVPYFGYIRDLNSSANYSVVYIRTTNITNNEVDWLGAVYSSSGLTVNRYNWNTIKISTSGDTTIDYINGVRDINKTDVNLSKIKNNSVMQVDLQTGGSNSIIGYFDDLRYWSNNTCEVQILKQTAPNGNIINRTRVLAYNMNANLTVDLYSRANGTSTWTLIQSNVTSETWYPVPTYSASTDFRVVLKGNLSDAPILQNLEYDWMLGPPVAPINSQSVIGNNYINTSWQAGNDFSDRATGTQIDMFENVSAWILSGTDASIMADTTTFKEGIQGINVTAMNGNYVTITKNILFNFSSGDGFVFWANVTNASSIHNIALYFSSDAINSSWYNYAYANTRSTVGLVNGWNRIIFNKNQFTMINGESFNNSMSYVRLQLNMESGGNASVTFDDLRFNVRGRAKVLINFDDGWQSVYDNASGILQQNGQNASMFVITSKPDNNSLYIGWSNLTTLYNRGWNLGSHTVTHLSLTTVNSTQLAYEVNQSYDDLVSRGFGNTAKFFAYPNGDYNMNVIDALKAKGYVIARTIIDGQNSAHFNITDGDMLYQLKDYTVVNTTGTQGVENVINNTIAQNGVIILLYHQVVNDTTDVSTKVLTSDFQNMSNYLKSRSADIDVITFSDYYKSMASPTPDSYNVSINGVWTNGTTNTNVNSSFSQGAWQNLTVYAWNNTSGLSLAPLTVNININIPLSITSLPVTDPTTTIGYSQTFGIVLNRTANVTWYVNNYLVQINASSISANYTNSTAGIGTYNVTAIANDGFDSVSRQWNWSVIAQPTYNISGYVFDNYGSGLGNVLVTNGSYQINTTSSGYYLIEGLLNGTYNLSFSKLGFSTDYLVVTLNGADLIGANKTLYDDMPAASVSNPAMTTGNFYINNTWVNPTDADFNYTWFRYSNDTTLQNVSKPVNYLNLTWSPHYTQNISAQTVDTSGNVNHMKVWFNITIPNNVPFQYTIGNKVVNENENLQFNVTAIDADIDTITYGTNATKGTFNTTTGNFSWTPAYGDAGFYYWNFNSSDGYGGITNENVAVTVVNAPQSITSSSPAGDPTTTVGTAQTFGIALNRAADVTWYINGSAVQTNSSVVSADYTNFTAGIGEYNVTAIAIDSYYSALRTWNWTVIAQPTYNVSSYVFDNYGSGLRDVLVQNGSSKNTTLASGYYLITGLLNGTYNISYSRPGFNTGYSEVIINGADNTSANATIYDTTSPASVSNATSAAGNFYINNTWTNPMDADFNYTWFRYSNGTDLQNISSPSYLNLTWSPHYTQNISAQTVDTYGNINQTEVWFNATIPNNPPVQLPIGDKSVTAGSLLQFNVTATDADSDQVKYGTNATNGTLNLTTGEYSWQTSSSDAGTYIWHFSSSDSYGGVASETITVTVTVAPPLKYIPPAPVNLTSIQGNFWINNSWQAGAGNATDSYNVSVNGSWMNGTTSTYYNNTVGPHGWSNITIWAYNNSDGGSLSSAPASQSTQVANNVPLQTAIGNKSVDEGDLLAFTVSATDADNDTIIYGTNATKGSFNATTGNFSWTPGYGDAGIYTWYFNSSDGYGGVASETITVTVNNVPLSIMSSLPVGDPATIAGTAQTFGIALNRTANATWYIDGSAVQTDSSIASANYTNSTAAAGIYNVTVAVTDGYDSVSKQWNWTVNLQPVYAPGITSWSNNKTNNNSLILAVNTSETVNFNATANQTITTWNWYQDGVNQNNNYDNLTASWNTAGTKLIQVSTTNSNGTSNTITWTVTVLAQPATYTPPPPANMTSTTGNFWVNTTWQPRAGNTTDSYNVSVNGAWTNGTINTSVNSSLSAHAWQNVTVYAYNASGGGSLSASSAMQNTQIPDNPPIQSPIGAKSIEKGQWLNFTVHATDADNDAITYGTNATKGNLDTATGNFSWLTTYSYSGTYVWYFNSSDCYGGVASETITVTINSMPILITSSSPIVDPSTTVNASQTFGITLNRTANVTWYINGSTVQTNSNVISVNYTNSTAGVGVFNITATASDGLESASRVWNWTVNPSIVDTTPPVTNISLSGILGNNGWYISNVTAILTATDNKSDINYTEYNINNDSWFTYTIPFSVSTENMNIVYYYSVDNANDVEQTKSQTIKIDKTPPASITGIRNTHGRTYINWTWVDPTTSDTSGFAYVMVYLNGLYKMNVSKGVKYYYVTNLLPNTNYMLGTRTVDNAGNINSTWINSSNVKTNK